MKKTLLALSIIAAGLAQANAAEVYNNDGTSLSIDGDVTANALFGANNPKGNNPYTTGNVNTQGDATGGSVSDRSWFNLKPTGKSYFNGQA